MASLPDKDIIQVAALGRPLKLGMLYDCRTDELCAGYVWDESTVAKHTEVIKEESCNTKIISTDNSKSRAEALEICDRLKLSVDTGLVEVAGAAKYFVDTPSLYNQTRVALKFKYTTKTEHINIRELRDKEICFNKQDRCNGTHVVSSISYGNQVFFVFEEHNHTTNVRNEKKHESLTKLIAAIPRLGSRDNGFSTLTEEEKTLAKSLNVQTFGDVMPSKIPYIYEDVIESWRELSILHRKNDEKCVPVSVKLCSLSKLGKNVCILREVGNIRALFFQKHIAHLKKLFNDSDQMMKTTACQKFPGLYSEMEHFQQLIDICQEKLIKELSMLLPKIRSGEAEESVMDSLFGKHESPRCSIKEMYSWFQEKETEVRLLEHIINILPSAKFLIGHAELETAYMDPVNKTLVCLVIYRAEQEFFLKKMETFLGNKSSNYSQLQDTEWWLSHDGCEMFATEIRKTGRKFMELYGKMRNDPSTKFVVVEKITSDYSHRAEIILCKDGQILKSLEIWENDETDCPGLGTKTANEAKVQMSKTKEDELKNKEVGKSSSTRKNYLSADGVTVANENEKSDHAGAVHRNTHGCHKQQNQKGKNSSVASQSKHSIGSHFGPQDKTCISDGKNKAFVAQGEHNTGRKQTATHQRSENEAEAAGLENESKNKGNQTLDWKPCTPNVSQIDHDRVTLTLEETKNSIDISDHEVLVNKRQQIRTGSKLNIFSVTNLQAGKTYQFQVRIYIGSQVTQYSDPTDLLKTLPSSPPGKPKAQKTSKGTILLRWEKPLEIGSHIMINSYIVLTRSEAQKNWCKLQTIEGIKTEAEIEIDTKLKHKFKIIADCGHDGKSRESQESNEDWAKKEDHSHGSGSAMHSTEYAKKLTRQIDRPSPYIEEVRAKQLYLDDRGKIRKLEVGERNSSYCLNEKILLLVGATGSGKSTLINGIINYVLGVSWKDDVRYKLTDVSHSGAKPNQAKSQTTWITSYTIYRQPGSRIPYTLTVVDTPGFGDTSGLQRDQEIIQQVSTFFSQGGKLGLDQIDAVGFVVQSSLPRLTKSQKYMYDSLLSVFGKNIIGNIFLLLTFSDGQKPQVLDSLKEAKIPCEEAYFKFNNSALFACNTEPSADEDQEEQSAYKFNRKFWKMGYASYKQLLGLLVNVEPKSLSLSQKVLDQKQQLQICMEGLQKDIQLTLNKLEQLEEEKYMLRVSEADIKMNENYTYTVMEDTVEKVQLKYGEYTTNCLHCQRTCHYPCRVGNDNYKANCSAMTCYGFCMICPHKCHWAQHKNVPYIYEIRSVQVTKTIKDMKDRYRLAKGTRASMEIFVQNIEKDIVMCHEKVHHIVINMIQNLRCLEEIALKPPKNYSASDFIDILIQSEKVEAKPGFEFRMKQLQYVREYAVSKSHFG